MTFGCFNNFAKVTSEWLAIWARILEEVPGSRLYLKARSLADGAIREALVSRFGDLGVSSERLMLNGDELSVAAHFSLYHHVDIALDTFPYHGTTTTCEALWMGVPVISLAGQTHVSWVGASLLTNVGVPECIAHSPDEYVTIAVGLATDLARLSEIRSRLRSQMKQAPLCDAVRFTRNLEAAYRRVWASRMTGK